MTTIFEATFEENVLWQQPPRTGFEWVLGTGGTIEVVSAAAHDGTYGVRVTPVSNSTQIIMGCAFIRDSHVQRWHRQRFWFHPNGITIATGNEFRIARNGFPAFNYPAYNLRLGYNGTNYYLNFTAYNGQNDDVSMGTTGNTTITNAWHRIEIAYKAAVSGSVQMWVDGVSLGTISGNNSDVSVTAPGIGVGYPATSGFTVSGSIYFDSLRITDDPDTEIGA